MVTPFGITMVRITPSTLCEACVLRAVCVSVAAVESSVALMVPPLEDKFICRNRNSIRIFIFRSNPCRQRRGSQCQFHSHNPRASPQSRLSTSPVAYQLHSTLSLNATVTWIFIPYLIGIIGAGTAGDRNRTDPRCLDWGSSRLYVRLAIGGQCRSVPLRGQQHL